MSLVELILIAVALSMDAFAVSISKGLAVRRIQLSHSVSVAIWFGGFQALMPLVGYLLGVSFAHLVHHVDHWIAFVLLAIIGVNMIREAWGSGDSCENVKADFSVVNMLLLAVATSIDALAVGVSFAFLGVDILYSITVIGIVTALFSVLGLRIGQMFGCRYKSKAEIFGGVVLVLLGVKILVEHLYF